MDNYTYNKIFNTDNIFYDKLKFWYGKFLADKQVSILHTEEIEGKLNTVVFIIKENEKIEIARVFALGDHAEISIDLQCNTKCIGAIKQLIAYGGNFKKFEIEIE